ncbi:MAG: sorbosone dehydrogenase family protein [Acidimicrobiia bacterium]
MRPTRRTVRRRAAAALSAAALSAAVLAACGGEDTDGSTATTAAASATTTPAAPSTTAVDGGSATTTAPATTGPAAPVTTASPPTTARPTLAQVRARLQQLATFDDPVAVAVRPGDERIYVVERGGTIQLMTPGGDVAPEPVADLRRLTAAGGERGLLGLAFAPSGDRAYVNYTDTDGHTNVDELAVRADGSLDAGSRRRVLFIEQPYANHNGGHLRFGPDGLLYIGTGDGGSGGDPQGNGQKRSTLLGKMLRIDPTPAGSEPYTVPADNPFVGDGTTRPEIWSLGLRNPWGFSFDPANDDLWVADVGQDAWEEINVARAADSGGAAGRGVNFGWNAFEGTHRYDDSVDVEGALLPIHEYPHGGDSLEGCSVTGGVVYRGGAVPNLSGAYLFADYCVTGLRALDAAASDDRSGDGVRVIVEDAPSIVGFGHDADGEVLVVSLGGAVYRLVAS